LRILLVEDDEMLGDAVREALRQEGYVIDWVRAGGAALAALTTSNFSLGGKIELAAPAAGTGLVVTVTLPFTGAHGQARSAA
jgi:CheY-like chemotaxis protein